jgi:hypothetical protein
VLYSIYLLLFLAVLATEEEIYKKDSSTLAIEIIEIIFLVIFLIDLTVLVIAFGFKNVFNYYLNYVCMPIIITLLIWTLLDIIDKDEFRELGAFRFLRVLMIILKFNEIRFLLDIRIFNTIQTTVTSHEVGEHFGTCKGLQNQMKGYQSSGSEPATMHNEIHSIDEFGINASSIAYNKRRDSYNIRQKIKDIVLKYDFEGELALTPMVRTILEGVNDFEFNVLELSKATGGNEMTVLTTYLMAKHNLYVN